MSDFKLSTPVAFFIFNRPHTTAQVFEQIRQAKPAQLLVIADGPRAGHPDDVENCAATRAIIEQVDWDCEVTKNYADTNLGCKIRVAGGIDWVFDLVEEAILLEDDILPHPTFFRYCQELLEKYRHDERIMMISGCNFLFGNRRTTNSYYYSYCVHCWGWATWRRAWRHYDVNMALWPEFRDGGLLQDVLGANNTSAPTWYKFLEATYQGQINSWDFQWVFTCWTQNGLSIMPNANLVANIGFGPGATHTMDTGSITANLPTVAMDFPLSHPRFIVRDTVADNYEQQLSI
jgi:hypothetical protein